MILATAIKRLKEAIEEADNCDGYSGSDANMYRLEGMEEALEIIEGKQ